MNCIENVKPLPFAIGNDNGVISIPIPVYEEKNNLGSCSVGIGDGITPIHTIDSFKLSGVTLMKVDVEGHELEVLQGAQETITRCRPVLYIENDRIGKQEALCTFVESLGYSYEWHKTPIGEYFPDLCSLNILCLSNRPV